MDNKYYIPQLEEFHAGFRYQGYSIVTVNYKNDIVFEWEDRVFKEGHKIYAGNDMLIPENCRVKYLDRQDIEELGWKFEGLTKDGSNTEIYGGISSYTFYRLVCKDGSSSIAIFKALPKKGEGNLFSGKDTDGSYYLKINNYNELKFIMTKIGIFKTNCK